MTTETKDEVDDYFGVCPECGSAGAILNVGRGHWGYCEDHKVSWSIGANLFSDWRHETEEDWRRNAKILSQCREIPIADAAYDPVLHELRSRRAGLADRLCTIQVDELWCVMEAPGDDGKPCVARSPLFDTVEAADLFRADLIGACGDDEEARRHALRWTKGRYSEAGRIVRWLDKEGQTGDSKALAVALARDRPWNKELWSGPDGELSF